LSGGRGWVRSYKNIKPGRIYCEETMIRITIYGFMGHMGRRIWACARDDGGFALAGAIERLNHRDIGEKITADVSLSSDIDAGLDNTDVVIDFSCHDASPVFAAACARHGKPVVIGTTGLTRGEMEKIRECSGTIPVLVAPNMSLGVNLLFKVMPAIARALGDGYDIEIVEAHHNRKKDAPSGTALGIARRICEATGRDEDKDLVYGRHGETGPRPKRQIAVHAIRAGDIVGDHTVIFSAPGERIEVTHRAHSRDTFARGALLAAKFIVGKEPGLYDMADVLGLS